MKSRMRWVGVVAGIAVWLTSGCQAPTGPESRLGRTSAARKSVTLDGTTEHAILPETHLAAGRLHETQGQLDLAAEQYRAAAAVDPACVEALERLGSVMDRLGRFTEAEKAYQQALRAAPGQAWLHNNMGFSYFMQRRYRQAEDCFRQALDLQPAFARARVNLAMTLAQLNAFEDALDQFQMVLPAEDAYFNLGLMYQSKRRLVEAAKAFKTALELNPDLTAARNRLALLPMEALSRAEELIRTEALSRSEEIGRAEPVVSSPQTPPAPAPVEGPPRSEALASPLPAQAAPALAARADEQPAARPLPPPKPAFNSDVPDLAHPIPREMAETPAAHAPAAHPFALWVVATFPPPSASRDPFVWAGRLAAGR